jgi:hypothetical protein
MCGGRLSRIILCMLETGSPHIDAQRAFRRAARARRRANLMRRLRRDPAECGELTVFDGRARSGRSGIAEIPLCSILGTLEPSRATQFDPKFRPAPIARGRWERIWLLEREGSSLPPISVVAVGDGYAVRDGHHRVSVAHARGAVTIDATVERG